MTVAMKYILPPESALIGLLELALGPVWVYFGVGEVPSVWTMVAGVVLLITLGCHEYLGLRQSRAQPKAAPSRAYARVTDSEDDEALLDGVDAADISPAGALELDDDGASSTAI
mmetsp:Transcript_31374/g.82252  ORF Transcript_31374/g.82252 Transcript_31374/m.82252 type:complete len:114 (+) Transcript_31374:65-406(+)